MHANAAARYLVVFAFFLPLPAWKRFHASCFCLDCMSSLAKRARDLYALASLRFLDLVFSSSAGSAGGGWREAGGGWRVAGGGWGPGVE